MKIKRPAKSLMIIAEENDWGVFESQHGYGVFESEHGLLVINRIDEMEVFEGDYEAVEQAKKDGFVFLFNNVLDTTKNREIIKEMDWDYFSVEDEWF